MTEIVYKIRHKTIGEYVHGAGSSSYLKTGNRGRKWTQLHHLTNHINHADNKTLNLYRECELVTFELVEKSKIDVEEFAINSREKKKRKQEEFDKKWKQRQEIEKKEDRKTLYEELKKEFE